MSTTQVNAAFQETQLRFGDTFADLSVPGIGEKGTAKLVAGNETSKIEGGFAGGITNAAQVVGYFLRLNGDAEKMRELLVDKCGCHAPSVDPAPGTKLALKNGGTLAALSLKCEGCIAPEVDTSSAPVTAAAGTTKVMADFLSKQMSWKDTLESNPVPGLGPAGRKKMEADGITNVVQLIGLFMMLDGDEEAFVEYLLGCEIGEQYIRSERTKRDGTAMPGVLEAISEKATAICSKAEEQNVAMETVHEEQQAPTTPVRAAGSPVFTPSTSAVKATKQQGGGGWEAATMRKRAANAAAEIDCAAATSVAAKQQPTSQSESTCPSAWLLPVAGVAVCAVFASV